MVKLIHTADLHLGSKMQTHLDESKARKRRNELFETFENTVKYARENGVRAILLSGDVFDTESPTVEELERFFKIISKNGEIDFLYLSGNHDGTGALSLSAPENFTVMNNGTVKKYENVTVSGAALPADFSKIPPMPEEGVNIFMLHGDASENGNTEHGIPLSLLRNKNIDYLALGHIHGYSKDRLDGRGIYCYCGTPEPRGFDEPGADKNGDCGFALLTVDKTLMHEFVPFAKRRVAIYEYDASACESRESAISGALAAIDARPCDMVRLVFTGAVSFDTENLCEFAHERLDGYFVASVKNRTSVKINAADYATDPTLRGEFVRAMSDGGRLAQIFGENEKINERERELILALGIKILSGEDKA